MYYVQVVCYILYVVFKERCTHPVGQLITYGHTAFFVGR